MNLISKIKNIFALTIVLFFFSACGGSTSSSGYDTTGSTSGSDTTGSTSGSASDTAPAPVAKAIHEGQVKDSSVGGLANVKVSIGDTSTTTDADGFYTLTDLDEAEEAVVNFEKEGYSPGSALIQIKARSGDGTVSSNYLEYTLTSYDYQPSYDSETEAVGDNIEIPADVYTDGSGAAYEGIVTTGVEIVDPTTERGKVLFPGSFEGENSNGEDVKFNAYGMINISPKDTKGKELNFADGATATLIFDAVDSLDEQIIPLWYYDYDQGKWIEDGYAERQEDGTYKGEISHPGTWSLSKPIEEAPGIYRGRIVYENGKPAKDIRVSAVGDKWKSTDLSTDKDGVFEIEVVPGNSFQLKAYSYKDKYEAVYNGTIPAIASGEIVEDR
ncbi:MAG: carboxypeptidase-like regulatory domain-containing protein [Campylobacterota bacterium]|nr:carboxypeptidase-like regulatory domain-containing protein [Campylobacterota bacterium]